MSTPEREIELVAGTIGGITQKKADTWTVAVTPDGSQYAKNLWSKDADLIDVLASKIGQAGAFVCAASYWERDGKQIRSLWITEDQIASPEAVAAHEAEAAKAPGSVATPAAAPKVASGGAIGPSPHNVTYKPAAGDQMSKEEWARKDSAGHKRACIAIAVGALTHTMPSDPTQEQLNKFNANVLHLALGWHRLVLAERDDPTGESVPF